MNCSSCQREFEAYRSGALPGDQRTKVEAHLKDCRKCMEQYRLFVLTERVIGEEKEVQSNPFLQTRIMAEIERAAVILQVPVFTWSRFLKPVMIAASLAVAMLAGITIGNATGGAPARQSIPEELALMDDLSLESVVLLSHD